MKYVLIPFASAEEAARFTNSLPTLPPGIRLLDEREVTVKIHVPTEEPEDRGRNPAWPGGPYAD